MRRYRASLLLWFLGGMILLGYGAVSMWRWHLGFATGVEGTSISLAMLHIIGFYSAVWIVPILTLAGFILALWNAYTSMSSSTRSMSPPSVR